MKFRILDGFQQPGKLHGESLVILRRDNWNDFGFYTLFVASMFTAAGAIIEIGAVKILKIGQTTGPTSFDSDQFDALDDNYCSLGQDIEYYEKLATLSAEDRSEFLHSMRDAATDHRIASAFEDEEGWQTSLLRFGQAEHTLAEASSLFNGSAQPNGKAIITHRRQGLDAEVTFDFDDSGPLPGRCKVLIGYNGVGKTRLLADVARETSKVGQKPELQVESGNSTFSAVVAVSYSAFDTFELPPTSKLEGNPPSDSEEISSTTRFGYTYCGLRRLQDGRASSQLKSIGEVDSELAIAFQRACKRDTTTLKEALADIDRDPSFGRAGLRLSDWREDSFLPEGELSKLSAGQKIVINIIVQLGANLRNRSLVLIDEPETHLHPPLLAALLRGTQRLLHGFDSFAIVATHSPVVLQEVPAKDVQVIERFGTEVRAVNPQLETFGAGLGELTHEAFKLDNTVSDYRAVIRELGVDRTLDELESLFPFGLSSQARALAMRAKRESL